MNDFLLLAPSAVLLAAGAAICAVYLLALWLLKRSFSRHNNELSKRCRQFEKELQKTSKQLIEVRSAAIGLGQKVTNQQELITHLNERIKQLENVDSDGRLYSRASKMVKLGADIEELIEECELPKAEAELMLSLQKKLAGQESIPPLSSNPDEKFSRPLATDKKTNLQSLAQRKRK